MPGYDPTTPGLAEATRTWIISQIVNDLPRLNQALTRDNLTPIGSITASMILRGDPQIMPDVSIAPLLICVLGGGRMDARDMDIDQKYIGGVPYHCTIYSSIMVYVHPDCLPAPTGNDLESGRELVLDRVCDWLRAGVFNAAANASALLTSREYVSAPAFDVLDRSHIEGVEKGLAYKQFSGSEGVYHAHLRHSGEIDGTNSWAP